MAFRSLGATGKLKAFTVWFQASFWYILVLQYYTYCTILTRNIKACCNKEVKHYLDLLSFFWICALIYLYREQQNYQLQALLFHPPITMHILKQQWIPLFSSGPQHRNASCALLEGKVRASILSGTARAEKLEHWRKQKILCFFPSERWRGKIIITLIPSKHTN